MLTGYNSYSTRVLNVKYRNMVGTGRCTKHFTPSSIIERHRDATRRT